MRMNEKVTPPMMSAALVDVLADGGRPRAIRNRVADVR